MLTLLSYLLVLLPWKILNPLLSGLTFLRLWCSRKERKILFLNIAKIWGLPAHSSFAKSFAYQVLRTQMQIGMETLKAAYKREVIEVIRERGVPLVRVRGGEGTVAPPIETVGCITITAHLGNWEWVGKLQAEHSHEPFHALAKKSRRPQVDRWMTRLRKKMGIATLDAEAKSTLRNMLGILRKGENLGFVMDQKPKGRQGPVVTFFNQPTPFVAGPAMMASKTGASVIAVFCVREGPMQYRVISDMLLPPGHSEKDVHTLTQRFATKIESIIRMYPEQWCWNYKRWRWDSTNK